MDSPPRSGCPINLAVQVFGDRWSLVILRDIVFGGRRHYRELLTQSDEGISTNILADRLKMLVAVGLLTKEDDPTHKQKSTYSLTEQSITLLPILAHLGEWGRRWLPATPEMSIRAELLMAGGPPLWERFMQELRVEHLGARAKKTAGPTVREELGAAYLAAVAKAERARPR